MLKKMKREFVLTNICLVAVILGIMFVIMIFLAYEDKMNEIERALHRPVNSYEVANEAGYLTTMYIVTDNKENVVGCYNKREVTDESLVGEIADELLKVKTSEMRYNDKFDAYYSVMKVKNNGGWIISAVNGSYVTSYMYKLIIKYILLYIACNIVFYSIIRKNASKAVKPIELAWEEQKRFIADVSHELKTPLAIISANNHILKDRSNSMIGDEIKWVNGTLKEVDHMKELLKDMMYLAKHDSFDLEIEKKKLDLSDMVAEDILHFEPVAYEDGIDFDYEIEPDIFFDCDEKEIRQLGRILLDNAAKYSSGENGKKIFVSLKKKQEIILSVKNTSQIIPAENLERIFSRFYRGDEARTKNSEKRGYGLGLAIAETIVKKHKGTIKAFSGPTSGPYGLMGTEIEVRFKA